VGGSGGGGGGGGVWGGWGVGGGGGGGGGVGVASRRGQSGLHGGASAIGRRAAAGLISAQAPGASAGFGERVRVEGMQGQAASLRTMRKGGYEGRRGFEGPCGTMGKRPPAAKVCTSRAAEGRTLGKESRVKLHDSLKHAGGRCSTRDHAGQGGRATGLILGCGRFGERPREDRARRAIGRSDHPREGRGQGAPPGRSGARA